MNSEKAASTPVDELQQQREKREERRAVERGRDQHVKLIAKGKESKTRHGVQLMQLYAEELGMAIDALLSELLVKPDKAGPYFAFWPLLLHFCDRGPRSISLITLGVVIDNISTRPRRADVAKKIGKALQDELKGTRIHQGKGTVLLNALRKKFGKGALVSVDTMAKLQLDPSGWTTAERKGVGNLLLEIIAANTDLIKFCKGGRYELIEATEHAKDLIKAAAPWPMPVRMLPSLIPIEPWAGLMRGPKPLVTSRQPMDTSHLTTKSLATAIEVVNAVEQQELVIDKWMTRVQRQAWEYDLPVFPVRREPERGYSLPDEALVRTRVEEVIRQAEEVAGFPIWLKHDMDFRGRLYCASKFAGHQGPDHQKALISFAQRERMNDDAFEQLLAAAAGHYGLGHCSWGERCQWGRAHLDQMVATAANPLDRVDLWKAASDPWQYLQCCKAVADYVEDDQAGCGIPIRFDQTCSGMGIIAALTRDAKLARHTNLIGSTRHDLYSHVSNRLVDLLRMDLDSWDHRDLRMAELWLQYPIGRDLAKGPTMTTIYGARHFGIVEQLVEWLQGKNPDVPVQYWEKEYTRPAQYLARKLNIVIGAELKSCVAVEKWLRSVSSRCVVKQQRIRFQSPMAFPLSFGVQLEEKQKTNTVLHGSRRWQQAGVIVQPGELSARATNRGITANVIHAFDAAYCHAVVLRCAQNGAPVLTNHDCFATIPSRAEWLHNELSLELRKQYLPDWLAELRVEIGRNAGVTLPHPPHVGDLKEGKIGENPYCFC